MGMVGYMFVCGASLRDSGVAGKWHDPGGGWGVCVCEGVIWAVFM